jgi:hypothetical protein
MLMVADAAVWTLKHDSVLFHTEIMAIPPSVSRCYLFLPRI